MNSYLLDYKNEIFRKLIHLTSLFLPITYYFINFNYFYPILIILFLLILFINNHYQDHLYKYKYLKLFFSNLLRNYEKKSYWGASYLVLGFLFISIFFNKNIVIISMIITSFSDSMAAIIGIKYGKLRIFNNKSIEGFYAFFISTFTIIYFSLILPLFYLLIIALFISLVELLTPTKYDNLTIPLSSSILLYLFLL